MCAQSSQSKSIRQITRSQAMRTIKNAADVNFLNPFHAVLDAEKPQLEDILNLFMRLREQECLAGTGDGPLPPWKLSSLTLQQYDAPPPPPPQKKIFPTLLKTEQPHAAAVQLLLPSDPSCPLWKLSNLMLRQPPLTQPPTPPPLLPRPPPS